MNPYLEKIYSFIFKAVLAFLWVFSFSHCDSDLDGIHLESDVDNGGLFLPNGFEALVVVDSIGQTRHIAVNDNGDIYVQLLNRENGKETIGLRDTDYDGRADSIVHFGDYFDKGYGASGITIHNGYLYLSSKKIIKRAKLKAGELVPANTVEVVFKDMDPNVEQNWHTTKPIAFDDKGNMYIPFGAPSDACQDMEFYSQVGIPGGEGLEPCPELENHAGIWMFDANKIGLTQEDGQKYATGIRIVTGMEWNPIDNSLYAVSNGMDNFHTLFPDLFTAWQGAVLPAETLMKITQGQNYGWPYAYYDHIQDKYLLQPGYGGDGKKIIKTKEYNKPVFGFPGHWTPMDVMFYHGNQFPARYNNGAFIAFHGSTDRSPYPQAGFIVCFVPFDEEGHSTGEWEVFADGFTGVDTVVNTSDAAYRPMSLSIGPDGSLYISESNQGKIWRVMYRGNKTEFSEGDMAAMKRLKETKSYIKDPDPEKDIKRVDFPRSGWILYNTYCASCHQTDGRGENHQIPPLMGSEWVAGDEDSLIDIVLDGFHGEIIVNEKRYNGEMPYHRHLDDFAIASILTYIRKVFGKDASPISQKKIYEVRHDTTEE